MTRATLNEYCTIRDAAVRLGVTPTHVRRLIDSGHLSAVRVGDIRPIWLVTRESLNALVSARLSERRAP